MNILVIELTGSELVTARFRKERSGLRFLDGSRQPLEPGADLAPLLPTLPAAERETTRLILALPPSRFFFRELTLPMTDRKKVRAVLPLELKGETALESDTLLFEALPLADGRTLAIWCQQEPMAAQIARLTELGLEPEIVTVSLFAWDRLLPAGSQETLAISDGTSCAVYRAGQPLFFRAFAPGAAADQLDQTLAALEVAKGVRAERLLLHGRAAAAEIGVDGDSPALLPLAGELANAFGDDAQAARDLAGAFAVAQAACFGDPINFRYGPLAYTRGRQQLHRQLRLTAILAVALVLLIFGELGVRIFLVKRDLASLNGSIGMIYKQAFPNRKKPVDEVAELRSEIKRLTGGGAGSNVLLTLKQLAQAKGDEVTGIFELELDGNQVRGKGDARSAQAATDFRSKVAGILDGVEVSEIKSRPDGTVGFSFRGTTKEVQK
jgi:general secretion pathway protein L